MPDERRSHPHRDGSLKLRDVCFLTEVSVKRIALAFFGIMFDLCDAYCHLLTEYFVDYFLCASGCEWKNWRKFCGKCGIQMHHLINPYRTNVENTVSS